MKLCPGSPPAGKVKMRIRQGYKVGPLKRNLKSEVRAGDTLYLFPHGQDSEQLEGSGEIRVHVIGKFGDKVLAQTKSVNFTSCDLSVGDLVEITGFEFVR